MMEDLQWGTEQENALKSRLILIEVCSGDMNSEPDWKEVKVEVEAFERLEPGMDQVIGIKEETICLQNGNAEQIAEVARYLQKNPSSLRSLEIVDVSTAQNSTFGDSMYELTKSRENIGNLLLEFGRDIEYFCHRNEPGIHNYLHSIDWYSVLIQWLTNMPNLTCMALIYPSRKSDPTMGPATFPRLEKLTDFAEGMLPEPVFAAALTANSHITTLTTTLSCSFRKISLPNLKNLTVYVASQTGKNLLSLAYLNCDLESLKIVFCDDVKNYPISQAMGVLQNFQKTLVNLEMNMPVYPKLFSPCPVDAPKLSKLKLNLQEDSPCKFESGCGTVAKNWSADCLMEFLSSFQSLECLVIVNWKLDESRSTFRTASPREQLKQEFVNPVFKMLPALKKLEILPVSDCANQLWKIVNSQELIYLRH